MTPDETTRNAAESQEPPTCEKCGERHYRRTRWFPHVKTPKSVGREGMVTIWASDGLYLGCMGVETWKRLLEEEAGRA